MTIWYKKKKIYLIALMTIGSFCTLSAQTTPEAPEKTTEIKWSGYHQNQKKRKADRTIF
jgi:hypothetical protein